MRHSSSSIKPPPGTFWGTFSNSGLYAQWVYERTCWLRRKSQNLQTSGRLPLSSRVSDCLVTPLAPASSWKSKGAARRIVKDKGSGLIRPIETRRKRTDQCKELEDSDADR